MGSNENEVCQLLVTHTQKLTITVATACSRSTMVFMMKEMGKIPRGGK